MSNRAYLFSGHRTLQRMWNRPERDYYDSRDSIPAAWFFFFRPSDIQEMKLLADRRRAIELFTQRLPLLHRLISGRIGSGEIAEFLATVGGWPGPDLLVDPGEVLGGLWPGPAEDADAWHAARFGCLLAALDSEIPNVEALHRELGNYADLGTDDHERLMGYVLGHTYRWSR